MNNSTPYRTDRPVGCPVQPMEVIRFPYSTASLVGNRQDKVVRLGDVRGTPFMLDLENALAAAVGVSTDNKCIYGVVSDYGLNVAWFRFHDAWVQIATGWDTVVITNYNSRGFDALQAGSVSTLRLAKEQLERAKLKGKGFEILPLTKPKRFESVLADGVSMPSFEGSKSFRGLSMVPNWLHPLHKELELASDMSIFDVYTSRAVFEDNYSLEHGKAFQFEDSIVVLRADRDLMDVIREIASSIGTG